MALRPDGAILLAKKEHPGSVGSVYEFGSGACSGADGRQARLTTPLAAWRARPLVEWHARPLATMPSGYPAARAACACTWGPDRQRWCVRRC